MRVRRGIVILDQITLLLERDPTVEFFFVRKVKILESLLLRVVLRAQNRLWEVVVL